MIADLPLFSARQRIRSASDALKHHEKAHRPELKAAREVALELAQRNGSTHVRAVRDELRKRGMLSLTTGNESWLGSVFAQRSLWEPTGEWHSYRDDSRNTHSKRVQVWRLRGTP